MADDDQISKIDRMKKKYSSCLYFMFNIFRPCTTRRRSGYGAGYYETSSGDEAVYRRSRVRPNHDSRGPFGVAEPNIDKKASEFIAKFHCTTRLD
ncbi:hypothetical protein BVC80_1543g53 [Macleaya cordata]|uniref:Uncharacterized protein n=1 Tax=Macleaya cordata TaxID=56857 RepID=A0A200R1M0_MACCD|nr:hypothetical protein BVC80_1543g53 [Macleaya cordata]